MTALACAAAVLALSLLIDGARGLGPDSVEAPRLGFAKEASCGGWTLLSGQGQVRGVTVSLFTDGLARHVACHDDERDVLLRGSVARGIASYAVLEDLDGVRFAGFVDGELVVRARGDLRLAFTNDLATADEDRNLHATLR